MTCTHLNGGLQILIHRQEGWFSHCLCCGAEKPEENVTFSPAAGDAAALAVTARAQRRFKAAAASFARSAWEGGDPRCCFAALVSELGVIWCGDEYQPTFYASHLPRTPLEQTPEWQSLSGAAAQLAPYAWQGLNEARVQLEEILSCIREREGRSGCDVFLCYRRTRANVRAAMLLYRDLKAQGLRVFCADVTTRGKTQAQFEAEVYHSLNTAEHLVLFPGDGEDALTPWLHNELERAVCPMENRLVCSDGHRELPAGLGEALSLEAIRMRLSRAAAECTTQRLWERGMQAMKTASGMEAATTLFRRAAARKLPAARLMLATLYEEGALLPADEDRAAHYRRLAAAPDEACRQQVFAALDAAEQHQSLTRRQALVYVVADVSDAGLSCSQTLLRPLMTALQADRRLAGAQLCLVGYDRHAAVISEPRALAKYGRAQDAALMLHTMPGGGRDQHAYAAKGLRCAADHRLRHMSDGMVPLVVLLSSGAVSDCATAVPAALASLEAIFPNTGSAQVASAAQIPGCIAGLLSALQ